HIARVAAVTPLYDGRGGPPREGPRLRAGRPPAWGTRRTDAGNLRRRAIDSSRSPDRWRACARIASDRGSPRVDRTATRPLSVGRGPRGRAVGRRGVAGSGSATALGSAPLPPRGTRDL